MPCLSILEQTRFQSSHRGLSCGFLMAVAEEHKAIFLKDEVRTEARDDVQERSEWREVAYAKKYKIKIKIKK